MGSKNDYLHNHQIEYQLILSHKQITDLLELLEMDGEQIQTAASITETLHNAKPLEKKKNVQKNDG